MIPFLKKQRGGIAGISTEYRKPDETTKEKSAADEEPGLKACAADLMRAVSNGDEIGVAKAIRAAFEILDSEPHEEGEHINKSEQE